MMLKSPSDLKKEFQNLERIGATLAEKILWLVKNDERAIPSFLFKVKEINIQVHYDKQRIEMGHRPFNKIAHVVVGKKVHILLTEHYEGKDHVACEREALNSIDAIGRIKNVMVTKHETISEKSGLISRAQFKVLEPLATALIEEQRRTYHEQSF